MKNIFQSEDSRFALKTALLVTMVPAVMFAIALYSTWFLISINYSYFLANGIPLDKDSLNVFFDYLLKAQAEQIPFVGLFFIGVFFIGLFLSYIVLRPFNQLAENCHRLQNGRSGKSTSGLENRILMIKLTRFLEDYYEANRKKVPIAVPDNLQDLKKPPFDFVFYVQFFSIISILMGLVAGGTYYFTDQLHESMVETGISVLKSPKGFTTFLESQKHVYDLIMIVPITVGSLLYILVGKMIISNIEGTTFGYVRDIIDVANGNHERRIRSRQSDPGKQAQDAVNQLFDHMFNEDYEQAAG